MEFKTNYPSDLNTQEWQEIEEFFTFKQSVRGRKPKYSRRLILNAIFYILRTGCQWRYLPKDFPPWKTVYTQYRRWEKQNCFDKANYRLVKRLRVLLGRDEQPSGAIVDSQSVKTCDRGGLKGFDAGKKIKGRKRHILVDTQGLLLNVNITAGNISDKQGFCQILERKTTCFPSVKKIWADHGYQG